MNNMSLTQLSPSTNLKTSFISSYENGASNEYCDRMIQTFEDALAEPKEGNIVGEFETPTDVSVRYRRDLQIYLGSKQTPNMVHVNYTSDLKEETDNILRDNLKKYILEYPSLGMQDLDIDVIKVQKTLPKGGFHSWHCEHGIGQNSPLRSLVWTIYLNDVPDGEGETEFLEYGIKTQPKKGLVSFFPASFTHTHRGNAVYSCEKYIATGWFNLRPNDPNKTNILGTNTKSQDINSLRSFKLDDQFDMPNVIK
tara:strand:+ start:1735 stop:2493 length:759 start_codon:yes stop_codon:yes gene_type:complete